MNAFMAFVRDDYGWGDYKRTGIRKDLKKQADRNLEKLAVIIYLYDSALEIFSELFEERYNLLEPIENYEFPDESQLPLDEDQSSISQKTEIGMEQSVNTDNIQVSPDPIEPKIAISNTFDDETVDAQLNVSSDTEITSSTRVDMSDISKSPVDSSTESDVLVPYKISQEEYEIPAQSESSLVEFEVVPSEIPEQSEISQVEFEVVPPKIQKQSELSNDDYEIQLQREISHEDSEIPNQREISHMDSKIMLFDIPNQMEISQEDSEISTYREIPQVDSQIPKQGDTSKVDSQIPKQGEIPQVDSQIPKQGDTSKVDSQIPKQGDTSKVDSQIPKQGEIPQVDSQIPKQGEILKVDYELRPQEMPTQREMILCENKHLELSEMLDICKQLEPELTTTLCDMIITDIFPLNVLGIPHPSHSNRLRIRLLNDLQLTPSFVTFLKRRFDKNMSVHTQLKLTLVRHIPTFVNFIKRRFDKNRFRHPMNKTTLRIRSTLDAFLRWYIDKYKIEAHLKH